MPDERESQPPKVAIIEPGRHGARLRVSQTETSDETPGNDEPATRRSRDDTPESADEPTGTVDLLDEEAPHPLLRFSTEELKVELARRQRQVEYLKLQHGALLRQIAELELQIARLSPSGHGAGARRAPRQARATPAENSVSLADAIAASVPVGASVTPAEAARRVLATGYKSNARRFGVLVATALGKDARFERVGRGEYRRAR